MRRKANMSDRRDRKKLLQQNQLNSPKINKPAARDEKLEHLRDRVARGERWMIVLTASAVLIAAMQWYLGTQQRADSRESTQLDQRAWIGIKEIRGWPIVDQSFRVTAIFENTGKTPARNLSTVIGQAVRRRGDKLPPLADGLAGGISEIPTVLAPGATIHAPYIIDVTGLDSRSVPVTRPLLEAYRSGELIAYIFGRADYRDVYQQKHWLEFCYTFNPRPQSWVPCDQYNDFDPMSR